MRRRGVPRLLIKMLQTIKKRFLFIVFKILLAKLCASGLIVADGLLAGCDLVLPIGLQLVLEDLGHLMDSLHLARGHAHELMCVDHAVEAGPKEPGLVLVVNLLWRRDAQGTKGVAVLRLQLLKL